MVPVHTIKPYRGRRCLTPFIINLSTRCRWVAKIKPRRFIPPTRQNTGTPRLEGWVVCRVGLDVMGNRNVHIIFKLFSSIRPSSLESSTQSFDLTTRNNQVHVLPHILIGASSSRSMGWDCSISLDAWHNPRISFSFSWTSLPTFFVLTAIRTKACITRHATSSFTFQSAM